MSFVERKHRRYIHHAEISTSFEGRAMVGDTVNVSRGGLCALLEQALPVGLDLTVELALHFDDGALSESLSLRSRVVWCTAINHRYQVGVAFFNLEPEIKAHLEMFLRFLDKDLASAG